MAGSVDVGSLDQSFMDPMIRFSLLLFAIGLMTLLSSCGVNSSFILNHNQNITHVQLSENNFRVVDKVTGSAESTYVLFFGGLNKTQLYENAYSSMMDKANLMNESKTIINPVTEEYLGGVPPFYYKRIITVHAHVIEFNNQ